MIVRGMSFPVSPWCTLRGAGAQGAAGGWARSGGEGAVRGAADGRHRRHHHALRAGGRRHALVPRRLRLRVPPSLLLPALEVAHASFKCPYRLSGRSTWGSSWDFSSCAYRPIFMCALRAWHVMYQSIRAAVCNARPSPCRLCAGCFCGCNVRHYPTSVRQGGTHRWGTGDRAGQHGPPAAYHRPMRAQVGAGGAAAQPGEGAGLPVGGGQCAAPGRRHGRPPQRRRAQARARGGGLLPALAG